MTKGKAASGAGSLRKKTVDGKTYWEGRAVVGYDPATGKPLRKSVSAKTQKEARTKLAELTAAVDNGTYLPQQKITVAQWLDLWQAEYLSRVKPRTVDSYEQVIRNHIKPALGAIRLDKLTPPMIQRFVNQLGTGEHPLSPKSVKNVHGVFHGALHRAVICGYIKNNPADNAVLPKVQKTDIQPMTTAQIAEFLERIKGHQMENLFAVAVFTGMRQGELLGLSWDTVDFQKGILHIEKQLQRKRDGSNDYILLSPKSGKGRSISPAPFVMDALERERGQQNRRRLQAGPIWQNERNLVFTNGIGDNLKPLTVYKNFKRIVSAMGLPDLRFHDLRHTYAVTALCNGDSIKDVQSALGHHAAAFTMDTYLHVTSEMQAASANRMQNFIEKIAKQA